MSLFCSCCVFSATDPCDGPNFVQRSRSDVCLSVIVYKQKLHSLQKFVRTYFFLLALQPPLGVYFTTL